MTRRRVRRGGRPVRRRRDHAAPATARIAAPHPPRTLPTHARVTRPTCSRAGLVEGLGERVDDSLDLGARDRERRHEHDHVTQRPDEHTALDDRTRIVYSEILNDEQAMTAAAFWTRAAAWFATIGINCERVITDNGACYKSGLWHRACAETNTIVKKTRPRRPQTNGKVERYHRILLEEWAYIRPWTSERQRAIGYDHFIHFYNHHRPHGALGWATPVATRGDNLPAEHT